MKVIPRLEGAFEVAEQAASPLELAAAPEKSTRQRPERSRASTERRRRRRVDIILRSCITVVCVGLFILLLSNLAVLFDDTLAAFVVTSTLAVTALGLIKPNLVTPDRRR